LAYEKFATDYKKKAAVKEQLEKGN